MKVILKVDTKDVDGIQKAIRMLTDLLPGDKADTIHRMPRQVEVKIQPVGSDGEAGYGGAGGDGNLPDPIDQDDSFTLKRWCKKYDACRSCGKTDKPHMARGLCSKTSCYWKYKELPDDKLPSELPKL